MRVEITNQVFDPYQKVQDYQQQLEKKLGLGQYGATVLFVGSMRDFNEDHNVTAMELEYYPGMTESALEEICKEAKNKFSIIDSLVVHRVGSIQPNSPIVLVAVWSAHRAAGYDANRFIMEALKSKAPFWKKETTPNGTKWVDKNT